MQVNSIFVSPPNKERVLLQQSENNKESLKVTVKLTVEFGDGVRKTFLPETRLVFG